MAFVLLPCDLPTWPTIQRHLNSLKGTTSPAHLSQVLYTLHSLSNVSLDPDTSDPVPTDIFESLEEFLAAEADPDFFPRTLPTMVDAALNLKTLKPPQGLRYSLQQDQEDIVLNRDLVVSLLAHMFFCTLPKRTFISHPTLSDQRLAPTLATVHRDVQRVKVRALLHYFNQLNRLRPSGALTFSRKVMSNEDFVPLSGWRRSEAKLCPVTIQHEGGLEDAVPPALLACFSSPDLVTPALTYSTSQQVTAMTTWPELLVSAVFIERLEDNEALHVSGSLRTGTVTHLRTRPTFIPKQGVISPDLIHVLLDADDYRESEVLQYEGINVLRELNKASLAFKYTKPKAIPTELSEEDEDITSISKQNSADTTSQPSRFRSQVSSDPSEAEKDEKPKISNTDISKLFAETWSKAEKWSQEQSKQAKKDKSKKGSTAENVSETQTASTDTIPKSPMHEEKVETLTTKTSPVKHEVASTETDTVQKTHPSAESKSQESNVLDPETAVEAKEKVTKTDTDTSKSQTQTEDKTTEKVTEKTAETDTQVVKQESAGSFVTAQTTLRRRKKKKRGGRIKDSYHHPRSSKDAEAPLGTPVVLQDNVASRGVEGRRKSGEQTNVQDPNRLLTDSSEECHKEKRGGGEDDEETTRLLNRVIRAIERLEQERPELVRAATRDEYQETKPKTIARPKGKPPLPDRPKPSPNVDERGKKTSPSTQTQAEKLGPNEKELGAKPVSTERWSKPGAREHVMRSSGQSGQEIMDSRQRVAEAEDGKKLSVYHSCVEETVQASPPEDDHYYSACESLDGQDVARPRRPSRKRGKKGRRKTSFADRLKETLALAQELSIDSHLPTQPRDISLDSHLPTHKRDLSLDSHLPHPQTTTSHKADGRIARQESGGFVLEDDFLLGFRKQEEEEEEDMDLSDDQEEDAEEEDKDADGSDSSRYSFSSDYTSDLEDVYEKLGAALEDAEEGAMGPRTAAVARFAHGLLKRALSESYKDVTLGLDGTAVKTEEPCNLRKMPPRSLSFSEPCTPVSLQPPPTSLLKGEQGTPVVTGNWGCGSLRGDHQLKAMIQWAAASKAGAPKLVYYTYGDQNTVKLDIVCRLLSDRGWRVGDLVTTILRYCEGRVHSWRRHETDLTESADLSLPESHRYRGSSLDSLTLFDELIGVDSRPFATLQTEL